MFFRPISSSNYQVAPRNYQVVDLAREPETKHLASGNSNNRIIKSIWLGVLYGSLAACLAASLQPHVWVILTGGLGIAIITSVIGMIIPLSYCGKTNKADETARDQNSTGKSLQERKPSLIASEDKAKVTSTVAALDMIPIGAPHLLPPDSPLTPYPLLNVQSPL